MTRQQLPSGDCWRVAQLSFSWGGVGETTKTCLVQRRAFTLSQSMVGRRTFTARPTEGGDGPTHPGPAAQGHGDSRRWVLLMELGRQAEAGAQSHRNYVLLCRTHFLSS